MHSILLQATLRISYTSYIRQYIRRYSGSIGLGHCRGHCSTWPGLFFLRVMVILSSLGLHHTHHRRSPLEVPFASSEVPSDRETSKALSPTRCWPQHHEPSCWPCSSPTCCCLHSERALRSATTDKWEDKWLQRFRHSHSHADHCHARLSQNVFAFFWHFSCFEIFSRYFEFWVPGPSNIVAFTFDLPLEIFRDFLIFFSAVLGLFFVFVYIVSFTSSVFFCTPPCPFTCRHPLALAFFPFSIHLPLCWGSINTATFWWIHHRSSMVSHVTFGHVNSTKNDSRQQKVCKHVDYERISTWQCHDNYGGLNLVLCPAHEHAITSIYFWATKHIISLFKPSTISLSQIFYTKTLVEMIKFYRLNHPFIHIYIYISSQSMSNMFSWFLTV